MNIREARNKADTVVNVEIGGTVGKRFVKHAERNQPIRYYDRMSPEKCGHFMILGGKEGLPGEVIWYLKRVEL